MILKDLAAPWPVTESSGTLRQRHHKDGGDKGELINYKYSVKKILVSPNSQSWLATENRVFKKSSDITYQTVPLP
jgi:hypothetical protein